jgi:hypothetical protein
MATAMDKEEFRFPDEKEGKPDEEKVVQGVEEEEFVIVDDTPEDDRGRKPLGKSADEIAPDEEVASYGKEVQQRIKEMKRSYHDERRAKEEAQRERDEAARAARFYQEQAKKYAETLQTTTKESAGLAKSAAETELASAEEALERAYESGDAKAVVKATKTIAEAQAKIARAAMPPPTPLQERNDPVQTRPSDPIPRPDAKSREWQEANPWFGKDEEMTSLALGLHQKLVRQGVDPRSDAYYDTINKRMREVFPNEFEGETEPPPPKASTKPAATVVAPASRSSAPKKIIITKSMEAIAHKLGVPVKEYARQAALLEGRNNG